jgi:hypothetical protein
MSTSRVQRLRSTGPITSGLIASQRWWDEAPRPAQAITPPPQKQRHRVRRTRVKLRDEFVTESGELTSLAIVLILALIVSVPSAVVFARMKKEAAPEALPLAFKVSELTNDELRQLANTEDLGDAGRARDCWLALQQRGDYTEQDRCSHAALLTKLNDFTGAGAVLGGSPGVITALQPARRTAWINLWREAGDFQSAAAGLKAITRCTEQDIELAFQTVKAAEQAKAEPAVTGRIMTTALNLLYAGIQAGGEAAVEKPIQQLIESPPKEEPQRAQALKVLEALKKPTVEQKLAQARFYHPLDPDSESPSALAALRAVIQKCGALTVADKVDAARYLLTLPERSLVLEIISRMEAATARPLFALRMEAALEMGDWKEVGHTAAAAGSGSAAWARALMHAATELVRTDGPPIITETLLSHAITEAEQEKRWTSAYTIAQMALAVGQEQIATKALQTALELAPDQVHAIKRLVGSYRGTGRPLHTLRIACQRAFCIHVSPPPALGLELAYVSLLCGQEAELPADRCASPEVRLLYALDAIRRKDTVGALAMIQSLPKHRWHQGKTAVIASILAAGGQIEAARALFEEIHAEHLLVEERDMAKPWQSTLQTPAIEPKPAPVIETTGGLLLSDVQVQ